MKQSKFNTIAETKTIIDNSGVFEWIELEKIDEIYEWAFRNAKTIQDVENFLNENPEYCK